MKTRMLILVLNPGSVSTKVAVYDGENELSSRTLEHSAQELDRFSEINEQLDFRKEMVLSYLREAGFCPEDLSAIACRGGVIGQLDPGAYLVDEKVVAASRNPMSVHASNLGPIIGYEIGKPAHVPVYAYDMVCCCGVPGQLYTLSGIPEISRPFLSHVLNVRAVCFEQARREGRQIQDTSYVVSHLGGGITSNLVVGGKIRDLVGDDEGTFSPERAGGLPCRLLVQSCFSGKYREKEMQTRLKGKGGMVAYLGTGDLREAQSRIESGDRQAALVVEAMAMQVAKDILSLFAVVNGQVDKIILTGGMAYSEPFTQLIRDRVAFAAPVEVIAGTYEMEALAKGVYRVLRGEEQPHRFS